MYFAHISAISRPFWMIFFRVNLSDQAPYLHRSGCGSAFPHPGDDPCHCHVPYFPPSLIPMFPTFSAFSNPFPMLSVISALSSPIPMFSVISNVFCYFRCFLLFPMYSVISVISDVFRFSPPSVYSVLPSSVSITYLGSCRDELDHQTELSTWPDYVLPFYCLYL